MNILYSRFRFKDQAVVLIQNYDFDRKLIEVGKNLFQFEISFIFLIFKIIILAHNQINSKK